MSTPRRRCWCGRVRVGLHGAACVTCAVPPTCRAIFQEAMRDRLRVAPVSKGPRSAGRKGGAGGATLVLVGRGNMVEVIASKICVVLEGAGRGEGGGRCDNGVSGRERTKGQSGGD